MKICITFLALTIPIFLFSQSISSQKIVSYAKFQDLKIIANDLDKKGFVVDSDDANLGAVKTEDSKNVSEVIYCEVVKENNVFSVVYQSPLYYEKMKSELINSNSEYIKKDNGISFYENGTYRVGINDSQKTIAIYTRIKKL